MKHIKLFESFREKAFIYFINSESAILTENFSSEDGVFMNYELVSVIEALENNGFIEGSDFILIEAAGDIKFLGVRGNSIEVSVKGQKYVHAPKKGVDIVEIARKFEKMLQFSSWKALNWLNRQTEIVSGSKKTQEDDLDKHLKEGHSGMNNYMFFNNLKTMKKSIDCMLALSPEAVDSLLNEHDWASDHISSAKDDTEEVCNWLCNNLGEPSASDSVLGKN